MRGSRRLLSCRSHWEAGARSPKPVLRIIVTPLGGPEWRREAIVSEHRAGQVSGVYSLAPMLSVRNGARAIEFYKAAFGASEMYRVEDPGGAVVARLSVAGAEFWLSDESPEHGNFSPESLGGGTVRMILTVPDPDAMFAKALAAGARAIAAVEEAYGWRLGRVADPFGHHWEIGRPLSP